VTFDIFIAIQS